MAWQEQHGVSGAASVTWRCQTVASAVRWGFEQRQKVGNWKCLLRL